MEPKSPRAPSERRARVRARGRRPLGDRRVGSAFALGDVLVLDIEGVLPASDCTVRADLALGYRAGAFKPPCVTLTDPAGRLPDLLLQQVPEAKAGKNGMHLDLLVSSLQEPVERRLHAGAHVARAPFDDAGWLTAGLADPEGNDLCLLVSPSGPARQATLDPHAPGAAGLGAADPAQQN